MSRYFFEILIQKIIHYILLIPITGLCAWLYYKTKDKINGFLLGLLFLIIGTILDLAITMPLFTGYSGFYLDPYLWIGFLEVIMITGIYKIFKFKEKIDEDKGIENIFEEGTRLQKLRKLEKDEESAC